MLSSMITEFHGRNVSAMMTAANQPFWRESLKAASIGKFGADAPFYTCSAQGVDADGIIDFLAGRGKFLENVTGLAINPHKVCKH